MSTLRLRGGRVYDPANGIDGERRDLCVRDGRIVELDAREPAHEEIDASGCIVMVGGRIRLFESSAQEQHQLLGIGSYGVRDGLQSVLKASCTLT